MQINFNTFKQNKSKLNNNNNKIEVSTYLQKLKKKKIKLLRTLFQAVMKFTQTMNANDVPNCKNK